MTARLVHFKKSARVTMHIRLLSKSVNVNYGKDCAVFIIIIFTDLEEARRLQARPRLMHVSDVGETKHVQAPGHSLGWGKKRLRFSIALRFATMQSCQQLPPPSLIILFKPPRCPPESSGGSIPAF